MADIPPTELDSLVQRARDLSRSKSTPMTMGFFRQKLSIGTAKAKSVLEALKATEPPKPMATDSKVSDDSVPASPAVAKTTEVSTATPAVRAAESDQMPTTASLTLPVIDHLPVEMMAIEKIVLDSSIQPRAGLDKKLVKQYAALMAAGVQFPPVIVFRTPDGRFLLADGFHRTKATRALGRSEIAVRVLPGDDRMARLYAMLSNVANGQALTLQERKECVSRLLLMYPEHRTVADATIGRQLAVSDKTVKKIRESLNLGNSEVAVVTFQRRDGTKGTMKTGNIKNRTKKTTTARPATKAVTTGLESPSAPTAHSVPTLPPRQESLEEPTATAMSVENSPISEENTTIATVLSEVNVAVGKLLSFDNLEVTQAGAPALLAKASKLVLSLRQAADLVERAITSTTTLKAA